MVYRIPGASVALRQLGDYQKLCRRAFASNEPDSIPGLDLWLRADDLSAVGDGNPITTWTSREGNSREFTQATAAKKPLYRASGIGGQPAADFDGTDDILVNASSFLTSTEGTAFIVFRHDLLSGVQRHMFGTSLHTAATNIHGLYGYHVTLTPNMFVSNVRGGSNDQVRGNTTVLVDTDYYGMWASSDTAYEFELNGAAQTEVVLVGGNTGDWFGDCTGITSTHIGGARFNSIEAQHHNGKIAEIIVYNTNLSAANKTKVKNYLSDRYSI